MKLYLYAGRKDVAATTLADLQLLIAALADPADPTNAATLARVTGKVETIVQSDLGEPLEIYSYDDASTVSSWVTDAAVTLACGLGTPDPASAYTYASTTSFSISGSSRLGTLALNTTALRDALAAALALRLNSRSAGARFTLHLRKSAAGVSETLALLPLHVAAGVLSATPEDLAGIGYVTTAEFVAGAVLHVPAITSLTGGGATALDGLEAGGAAYPVGCVVLLSFDDLGRHFRLKGTYLAASDVATGKVKPTNSDSVLNPCHWQML